MTLLITAQTTSNTRTVDVLAQTFSAELVSRVWEFLPIKALIKYGNLSKANRKQIQAFMQRMTDDEIRPFCRRPQELRAILWTTQSIISGSVALAALQPFQLHDWSPGDMDIYTTTQKTTTIVEFLTQKEGYEKPIHTKTSNDSDSHYHAPGTIADIITLSHKRGTYIDLIVSNNESALTPIFNFYGSHVINAVTGHGIFSAYPDHTINHRALFNGGAHDASFVHMPPSLQKCMLKYITRGFQFDVNAVVYLKAPHHADCKVSSSCPHTVRTLYDMGCLTLAFDQGPKTNQFVHNTMENIYNGEYTNMWSMGGTACDFNVKTPMGSTAILTEVVLIR
jgi:hypothetical protein